MTDPLSPLPPDGGSEPRLLPEADDTPTPASPAGAGAALAYGWRGFRANAGPMLAVVVIPVALQLLLAVAGRVLIHSVAKWFLFQVVVIAVGAIAALGVVRLALMIAGGEDASVGAAFRYDRWGAWVVFAALFGLLEGIGLALCVIPGALFVAYFGLAPYFFVDRCMGIGDALRASRAAVTGNGLAFAVLSAVVVGSLGAVLLGVGGLVTQAVAALALAFVYRRVTDQPVAEPGP
jgi:uncharacterized membrane protein